MNEGQTIKLDNAWKIARRRVSGENRLEIIGPDATDTQRVKEMGLFTEIVSFKTRYFIPINGMKKIGEHIKKKPRNEARVACLTYQI